MPGGVAGQAREARGRLAAAPRPPATPRSPPMPTTWTAPGRRDRDCESWSSQQALSTAEAREHQERREQRAEQVRAELELQDAYYREQADRARATATHEREQAERVRNEAGLRFGDLEIRARLDARARVTERRRLYDIVETEYGLRGRDEDFLAEEAGRDAEAQRDVAITAYGVRMNRAAEADRESEGWLQRSAAGQAEYRELLRELSTPTAEEAKAVEDAARAGEQADLARDTADRERTLAEVAPDRAGQRSDEQTPGTDVPAVEGLAGAPADGSDQVLVQTGHSDTGQVDRSEEGRRLLFDALMAPADPSFTPSPKELAEAATQLWLAHGHAVRTGDKAVAAATRRALGALAAAGLEIQDHTGAADHAGAPSRW